MALNPKLSTASVNLAADAVCATLNNGFLRLYDGTQAATADTAVGAQVLLAELRFNATGFGSAVDGVATANAITSDAAANATGTASWFRALQSNGSSVMFDGSVGTATADLVLNTVSIVTNAIVAVTAFTYTQPKS